MNCKYCNKEMSKNDNGGGLIKHQNGCKLNPDRIKYKSGFIEYNKAVKTGKIKKEYTNQYIKAKKLGLPKPVFSKETLLKISRSSNGRWWDDEQKKEHSERMKLVVQRHPETYNNKNYGRTKMVESVDSLGNIVKLNGTWEVLVSKYLTDNGIRWTNIIKKGFEYKWNGKIHQYFPDFYLLDYNKYIEVKGFRTERDICKWKDFPNELIIIEKKQIDEIKLGSYPLRLISC